MKTLVSAAALGALLASGAANAGFVLLDNAAPTATAPAITVPNNNNFKTQLAARGVTSYVLNAALGVSGAGTVSAVYFGKEAGYVNQFRFGGSLIFQTSTSGIDAFMERPAVNLGPVSAGALNLEFCALTISACLTNAQNDADVTGSVRTIGMWVSGDGNTAWLLWDDSGAGPDDNHDDMLVRLTYTAVPEPTTLGLLGLGLLGVGALARRRRA